MTESAEGRRDADVLIVGAGLAGATAARALADAGLRVRLLDKGRGPGGRLSTRRAPTGAFDHGASSLQAVGGPFRAWFEALAKAGVASPWRDGEWVGCPGMNAVVAHLVKDLAPHWSAPVARLEYREGIWSAQGAEGVALGTAPRMILAVPAPQALALLADVASKAEADLPGIDGLRDALAAARYAPCWAAMVVTAPEAVAPACVPAGWVPHPALARVVRESDKPARAPGHWVVHATEPWSEAHLERSADEVAALLREAFLAETGLAAEHVLSIAPHRWRYAFPRSGVQHAGLPECGLHLAGDIVGWRTELGVPPAEQAWRSGRECAATVLGQVAAQPKS